MHLIKFAPELSPRFHGRVSDEGLAIRFDKLEVASQEGTPNPFYNTLGGCSERSRLGDRAVLARGPSKGFDALSPVCHKRVFANTKRPLAGIVTPADCEKP